MNYWNPSKEHFDYIRGLNYTHNSAGLDYCIQENGKTLTITFAETGDKKEWIFTDFNFWPKIYDGVRGHRGIFNQYLSVRKTILDLVYSGRFNLVQVAGYSLGGGLTAFCVQDIGFHIDRDNLAVSVTGINYDGPRVFCYPSGKVKKSCKNRMVIVRNHWDPVHHLPPLIFGFKHYGKTFWIGKIWRLLPIQHLPAQVQRALAETKPFSVEQ